MLPISGYNDEARRKTPVSNPFPQGVAQRRHEMASKRALPPGASRRAAGRKERSLQGVEIAHFVEGKGNPGAAFPVVLARVLGTKGAFRRQKALISARKGEL